MRLSFVVQPHSPSKCNINTIGEIKKIFFTKDFPYLRVLNKTTMEEKVELTIAEKINRAKEGRSQSWIIRKMNEMGVPINDVQFSRKKNGSGTFTQEELNVLSQILSTTF